MNNLSKNASPQKGNQSGNPHATEDDIGQTNLLNHLDVEYQDPGKLEPDKRNARTHTRKQLQQIASSIKQFGFINPILVNGQNKVLAGHGRLAAAQNLSMASVPTLRIDHLTPAEQRAYALADNRLAELAGWDRELLAIELVDLSSIELDFDINITGFEMGEIDVLASEFMTANDQDDEDTVPEPETGPPITQPGDLWEIGTHRLLCADATKSTSYEQLLGEQKAQLIFTDPPYNVPIAGHVSGLGKNHHAEFAMASGEMSNSEFTRFLQQIFENLKNFSNKGSIHFVCMDWRHMGELLHAGNACYTELKNLCVWAKTNGGMGSLYRSQHELVFVFKSGNASHINNVELGRHGRYRTNLWTYAGANTFKAERDEELAMHPTVKPLSLVADAIQDCSHRRDIVLDPFCGSGTTLLAAEQTGRRGFGMEIDPRYCDVILKRMTSAMGVEPVLVSSPATRSSGPGRAVAGEV